ncbi:MAG: UDP-N-acetylglucosamine--N-acetylmuramyl-(pentapeptide) pyrophosphoryl-undecaprenol N-acetylglucosamine transferase [Armatimonadota bacterium]
MRVVVTGGGTGGHVYPALEVCRIAQEEADLLYIGSNRGMEGRACEERGIQFVGLDSGPVYSPFSSAGIKALIGLFRASLVAKKKLQQWKPDVVFSTGGYSSAPVMRASKQLGIPLAIHACDTIPGRSLRMFAKDARVVTSTFHWTSGALPGCKVVRTGHPIRQELREAVAKRQPEEKYVLVLGGSGGAKFLNEVMPLVAPKLDGAKIIHSAGKTQYDQFKHLAEGIAGYDMRPYLEADVLADAYRRASLIIARSGSGISEYAMARIPSILVPLPSSADDHQFHNAKEFESFGGASVLTQDERVGEIQATPDTIAREILKWFADEPGDAERVLAEWDVPGATVQIWDEIKRAATR